MSRYVMNDVIQVKKEVTYSTDPGSWAATDAVLVSNVQAAPLVSQNVPRNNLRNYFGASGELVGSAYKTISFDVEFQHSGTAGTAAAWDVLLQMCNFAAGSVLATPDRVEHALSAASAQASGTLRYFDDGALHLLLGAKGTFTIDAMVGARPVFKFTFIGLDGDDTATATPATDYSAYKAPLAVTDTNTGALTLGCTYATGALSGGTEYVSGGLTFDLGNQVQFIDLLGTSSLPGQKVEITGRESSGHLALELTAANVATFMDNVRSNTTQSLGIVHGVTAGLKLLMFMPSIQLVNPTLGEVNGRRMNEFDFRALTSATTGLDEFKLVGI
jgi:hypothetical protein